MALALVNVNLVSLGTTLHPFSPRPRTASASLPSSRSSSSSRSSGSGVDEYVLLMSGGRPVNDTMTVSKL